MLELSTFARDLRMESAFDVLAAARRQQAAGKDVVMLQIGDSPFPTPSAAKQAGIDAIQNNLTHYCPSPGLTEFRQAVAEFVNDEMGLAITADCVVAGVGAKPFEQYFCELFLDPGDEVLVFSPYFPTYLPNIQRRQAIMVTSPLLQSNDFRPTLADVERFVAQSPRPRAIFLNSPHNPTGGVARAEDIRAICDLIRGRNIALFSDEPYNHLVWEGTHRSPLQEPDMLEQCVACYTFSKSYSMSGWRLGYAVTAPRFAEALAKLINSSVSCVAPATQMAGIAALKHGRAERDEQMRQFRDKVRLLTDELQQIDGVTVLPPHATFYAFPNVSAICRRLGITSHGLAMYLLEGADDRFGVACLGGECFGAAGAGFLRLSCAEPDDRLRQAIRFFSDAFARTDRVQQYLITHPQYRPILNAFTPLPAPSS